MGKFGGIIYPENQIVAGLTRRMLNTSSSPCFIAHKNIEILGENSGAEFKEVWLFIDGTIFNINEIKDELKRNNVSLEADSLEEILINYYLLLKTDFLEKLDGNFNLILFDKKKNSLLLARDKIGTKPLYWSSSHGHLIFSSELKSILSTGIVTQTPSFEALGAYLFFGYIPQDLTPLKEINKLLPGFYLQYDLGKSLIINPYWSLSACFTEESKTKESFETIFQRALQKRNLKEQQNNIERTAIDLNKELLSLIWHLDEPCACLDLLSFWNAKTLPPNFISSIGQKELFEKIFQKNKSYFRKKSLRPFILKKLGQLIHYISPPIAFKLLRASQSHLWQINYFQEKAIFNEKELKASSPFLSRFFCPQIFFAKFYQLSKITSPSDSIRYLELKTSIPDKVLFYLNRMSKHFGVEIHTPYLDIDLIESIKSLPQKNNYDNTSKDTQDPSLEQLFSYLPKGVLVEIGLISPSWIKDALSKKRTISTYNQLYCILVLEIWYRLFIQPPATNLPNFNRTALEFLAHT